MIARADPDDAELDLLIETMYSVYCYDFRAYARSSLRRCVARAQSSLRSPSIAHLADRVAHEPAAFTELLRHITVQVSDLFRDPDYYRVLRSAVVPNLATYPSLRIWAAGCGNGEEVYSLAILLHEEGLLERSCIYATDINAESLRAAESGVYDAQRVPGFVENYLRAGGRASLSDYFARTNSHVEFAPFLRERLLFWDHSLATDAGFAEVQLVSCRNVLIYFARELQDRAIGLFRESLCPRGFLALGSQETLAFSRHAAAFEPFARDERIYRLK